MVLPSPVSHDPYTNLQMEELLDYFNFLIALKAAVAQLV
jgi:hypothetical protein